jgi:hypothetical protein
MDHLPAYEFQKCVTRYDGDSHYRGFSCWDQYLAMAFAQLTYRESLRDIEACLHSMGSKLYHIGFRGQVARSTLADANEAHDWRIFADFAQALIPSPARSMLMTPSASISIRGCMLWIQPPDLCLSLFSWARFRSHKAAIKLHTLLDLHGNIPTFIRITDGKVHDVNILDELIPEAGAFYVMDRGYIDFARLFLFTLCSAFFVVRTKENILLQRRYSHPVDKSTGVCSDQTVILTALGSAKVYPDTLRCVTYLDATTNRRLKFLTEQLHSPGLHHRAHLQVPLAGRIVLQVDQATSPHQGVLRYQPERREDSNLDCRVGLCARRYRPEAPRSGCTFLRNSTDSQPGAFRENAHFTGISSIRLPRESGGRS